MSDSILYVYLALDLSDVSGNFFYLSDASGDLFHFISYTEKDTLTFNK